ncbi:MAG: NTPase [Nitrososphaerota archaeon]|nr:NTPase [Nitrososphaerota archaeon]
MSRIWLVTGPPGVGKSTVVSKVVLKLKSAGVIVGGCTTSELRSGGARTGFEVRDLTSGRKGELASVGSRFGPKVGRYRVNLVDLAKVGAAGVSAAADVSEVVVIDEVGPMELVSPEFRRAVEKCIRSQKVVFAVVHERLEDDLLAELRSSAEETFELTVENRDSTADEAAVVLLGAAGGSKI